MELKLLLYTAIWFFQSLPINSTHPAQTQEAKQISPQGNKSDHFIYQIVFFQDLNCSSMKLLPPFLLAILLINAWPMSSRMQVEAGELHHGAVKAGIAEGTSIDNHHAIPRPDYDSWSSPGNMPGNGHEIGSEEVKP
jgi:hypothetical protein